MIRLKFTKENAPVKQQEELVNPMVRTIRVRPDVQARYDEGLKKGLAKMCAECIGWMKNKCEEPKLATEIQSGQRPCYKMDLDGRLVGVSEHEMQEIAAKERTEIHKTSSPENSGKKPQWQATLERWFKEKKMPNPDFMNDKRWVYWEELKKAAGIKVETPKIAVKVEAKTTTRRKV